MNRPHGLLSAYTCDSFVATNIVPSDFDAEDDGSKYKFESTVTFMVTVDLLAMKRQVYILKTQGCEWSVHCSQKGMRASLFGCRRGPNTAARYPQSSMVHTDICLGRSKVQHSKKIDWGGS